MFSNILVPLDGTAESNAALPLARTVAHATAGTITLLRVVNADGANTSAQVSADLQRIAKELAPTGPVNTVVLEGEEPARQILDYIHRHSADLVIMRTHGRGGLARAVLGSVTAEVLASSRVPIMLLRPGGRRISGIHALLVPIDGSPGGTIALGTAVQLSRATGASLRLLEVSVPASTTTFIGDTYGGMTYYDPAWDQEALESAGTYVEGIVKRLRAANIAADGEASEQPRVARAIVEAADAASVDLIVMSTRALTGTARALLGSTADGVVRSAHCPVLLIHRGAGFDEAATEFEPENSATSVPAHV